MCMLMLRCALTVLLLRCALTVLLLRLLLFEAARQVFRTILFCCAVICLLLLRATWQQDAAPPLALSLEAGGARHGASEAGRWRPQGLRCLARPARRGRLLDEVRRLARGEGEGVHGF